MSASKLPEWPENSRFIYVGESLMEAERDAALARMEALVEYVMHRTDCNAGDKWPCTCGLSELLAACERRSGG